MADIMDDYSVKDLNEERAYFMLGFLEQHVTPAQWEAARVAAVNAYTEPEAA